MSVDLVLELDNGTGGLAVTELHDERIRYLTHMHTVNHLTDILRQILHLELGYARSARLGTVRHQTVVVTGILILRVCCDTELKRMVAVAYIRAIVSKRARQSFMLDMGIRGLRRI